MKEMYLFKEGTCPECKEPVAYLMEMVPVCCGLKKVGRGFVYSEKNEVWWDDQTVDEGANHEVMVRCENGHSWTTGIKEIHE